MDKWVFNFWVGRDATYLFQIYVENTRHMHCNEG